ncbi:MAG: YdcH family protein [Bryobacteraceae bacterium]
MENHTQDEALKAHLLATDEAFRSLAEKHKQYKQAIDAIEAKAHVTPADEIEEHRLKKLKLAVKDQMNEILAHSKHSSVS